MRAVILARVSTDAQQLDSQVEKLIEEAKRMGYNDYTVVQAHESGVKLDTEERQTIQEMKKEIEKGDVDIVLIWEVSRLSRRPKVLYEVREYLVSHNVNLHCMTPMFTMLQPDGSLDPTASIVFAIFGTMAEQEAVLSKERMRRGRMVKRDKLGYIGGFILPGYKVENGKVIIDDVKAEVVRDVFKRYINGESMLSIGRTLLETGDIDSTSVHAAYCMVNNMLHRGEYAGIKGNTYDYPPIITQKMWDDVQKTINEKINRKTKTKTKIAYFGRGIVYDAVYKHVMTPAKGVNRYVYVNEETSYRNGFNMNMAESILAWAAQRWHKKYVTSNLDEKLEQAAIDYRKRKLKLQKDHVEAQKKIDKINERIISGRMNEEKGDQMIYKIKEYIKQISLYIIDIEDKLNSVMEQRMRLLSGKMTDIYSMPDEDAAKFVHDCISKMYVYKGNKRGESLLHIIYKDDSEIELYAARKGNSFDIMLYEEKIDIPIMKRVQRKF